MKQISLLVVIGLLGASGFGDFAVAADADEIMKNSHLAYYYAADDGVAEVQMRLISKKGKERLRQFTMLRLDIEDGGDQRYYTYFRKPSDISRFTFMVHKNPKANDRRWIYVPSVDLVKPISADDKNSSFVGSDFSYEDVSGRHWSEDIHRLVEEAELDSVPVYVIESKPRESYKGFARKLSYIDKESLLPLKEEFYDKKDIMIRRFRAEKIETVDGFDTITIRSMENLKKGSRTYIEFSSIHYNVGLTDDLFTERFLKNPPRKFIK